MNTAADLLGATSFWATVGGVLMSVSTSIVGVPLNVVIAASLGVMAGLAWNKDDLSRREQVQIAAGSVIAASAVTSLLALALSQLKGIELAPEQLAPIALLIALFGPRWVPAVNERIGPWLDKLPFIGKKGG